ncbi:CPL20 [Auxenochlorella protothecoides x Auxenochlorella symbiontica]
MSNEPGCPERSPAHSRGSHGTTPATPSTGLLPPDWLSCLFSLSMFHPCPRHPGVKRNECNFFCARCSPREGQAYCRMCLDSHGDCPGPVFQIRKYMYQTCVHVEDIAPLHDVTGIQAYLINSKRALLIHPKISALASANSALDEICRGCQRPLRSDCQYCSLHCKNVANSNRESKPPTHSARHLPPASPTPASPHPAAPPASAPLPSRQTAFRPVPRREPTGGSPPVLRPVPLRRGVVLDLPSPNSRPSLLVLRRDGAAPPQPWAERRDALAHPALPRGPMAFSGLPQQIRASSLHGSHHRPHALQPWTVRGGFQPRRSQELDPQQEEEAGFMLAPRQY